MPKVMFAVPSARGGMFSESRESMVANCQYAAERGYDVIIKHVMDAPVHIARNMAVNLALGWGADYLVMMDSDMYPHAPDILYRMLERFKTANHDMVLGAIAVQRRPPYRLVAFTKREDGTGHDRLKSLGSGIVEVDGFGTGMFVVPTSVLKKLSQPYFAFPPNPAIQGETIGEDVYFCQNCQDHGVRVYVDLDVDVGHFQYFPLSPRNCEEGIPADEREAWGKRMDELNKRVTNESE